MRRPWGPQYSGRGKLELRLVALWHRGDAPSLGTSCGAGTVSPNPCTLHRGGWRGRPGGVGEGAPVVPRTHGCSPRGEGTATNLPAQLHVPKATFQLQHVPSALLQHRAGCGMGARRHAPGPPCSANARRVPGHRCAGAVCCPQFTPRGGWIIPRGGPGSPFVPSVPVPSMLTLRWLPAAYSGWRRSRPKNARCPS